MKKTILLSMVLFCGLIASAQVKKNALKLATSSELKLVSEAFLSKEEIIKQNKAALVAKDPRVAKADAQIAEDEKQQENNNIKSINK